MSNPADFLVAVVAASAVSGTAGLAVTAYMAKRRRAAVFRDGLGWDLTQDDARLIVALSHYESRTTADLSVSTRLPPGAVLSSARRLSEAGWVEIEQVDEDAGPAIPMVRLTSLGADVIRAETWQRGEGFGPPIATSGASEPERSAELEAAIDHAVAELEKS